MSSESDVPECRYIPQARTRVAHETRRADYAFYQTLRLRRCNFATGINFERTRYRGQKRRGSGSCSTYANPPPPPPPLYTVLIHRLVFDLWHEVNTETPIDPAPRYCRGYLVAGDRQDIFAVRAARRSHARYHRFLLLLLCFTSLTHNGVSASHFRGFLYTDPMLPNHYDRGNLG